MNLINRIKKNEGFSENPYTDSEGYLTIGFGTKLPITTYEARLILEHRLNQFKEQIKNHWLAYNRMPEDIQEMCLEMTYQMGVGGFMKFKKMIQALEKGNYKEAYKQGLNSLWANQTPNRALEVLKVLKDR